MKRQSYPEPPHHEIKPGPQSNNWTHGYPYLDRKRNVLLIRILCPFCAEFGSFHVDATLPWPKRVRESPDTESVIWPVVKCAESGENLVVWFEVGRNVLKVL